MSSQLLLDSGGEGDAPRLVLTRAVRDEVDGTAVTREARNHIVGRMPCDLSQCGAVGRNRPDVDMAIARHRVEHDHAAIRRPPGCSLMASGAASEARGIRTVGFRKPDLTLASGPARLEGYP